MIFCMGEHVDWVNEQECLIKYLVCKSLAVKNSFPCVWLVSRSWMAIGHTDSVVAGLDDG